MVKLSPVGEKEALEWLRSVISPSSFKEGGEGGIIGESELRALAGVILTGIEKITASGDDIPPPSTHAGRSEKDQTGQGASAVGANGASTGQRRAKVGSYAAELKVDMTKVW